MDKPRKIVIPISKHITHTPTDLRLGISKHKLIIIEKGLRHHCLIDENPYNNERGSFVELHTIEQAIDITKHAFDALEGDYTIEIEFLNGTQIFNPK